MCSANGIKRVQAIKEKTYKSIYLLWKDLGYEYQVDTNYGDILSGRDESILYNGINMDLIFLYDEEGTEIDKEVLFVDPNDDNQMILYTDTPVIISFNEELFKKAPEAQEIISV
jgi:hypothetical protein